MKVNETEIEAIPPDILIRGIAVLGEEYERHNSFA